jgi:isopentenyl phosphate kinase
MTSLTFLKLGGSLITDKRAAGYFHAETTRQAADEIAAVYHAQQNCRLLIGHGSGSFGHVAAQQYGTANGVYTGANWRGFAEVATAARALNALVMSTLHGAGLPVFGVQPSASALAHDGRLDHLEMQPIRGALDHGLIPVVFGDVAFDQVRGGTIISTETVFFYLAEHFRPARILLLGEVEGVYDQTGAIIPRITPESFTDIEAALGGSHGTDVTGGMASKVRTMLALAERIDGLEIVICGGSQPGQLTAVLNGEAVGTLITAPRVDSKESG